MPGNLANPVVLDPFQAIIEVGWPLDKFLAFDARINRRDPGDFARAWAFHTDSCTGPPTPPEVLDGTLSGNRSLKAFHYIWDAANQNQPVTGGYTWRSNQWRETAITEVSGLPESPVLHEFPHPEIAAEFRFGPSHISLWPRAEWAEPAASPHASDLPVPFNAGLRFDVAADATMRMRGKAALGAYCSGGTVFVSATQDDEPHEHLFAPLVLDFAAIRLSARNKTWAPVAVRPLHNTQSTPLNSGAMWILCEPVEESS